MELKYPLLIILCLSICLNSCKKATTTSPSNSKTLIVGKWYITSHISKLYFQGVEVDSAFKTNFTKNDFAQYFNDGTGIQSSEASPAPNLSLFQYTISGVNLTQFNANNTAGVAEIITNLTTDKLSINYQLKVADPSAGKIYNERDYYEFSK